MQKLSCENIIFNFTPDLKEVYKVKEGEIFVVKTNDCFTQQITSEDQVVNEIDFDNLNAATGPIYVENAKPGDILKVEILDIVVEKSGVAVTVPGGGALGNEVEESIVRVIEIKNKKGLFKGIEIPIDPMIGVIGVAPAEKDGTWPTHVPWKHGGNMDTKLIKKGTSLYFKVNQEGGMLALGDCHAAMGDGELSFTGIEIPADVTLKVSVLKDKRDLEWPVLEYEDRSIVIASGENLEEAMQSASREAVKIIKEVLNITWEEAYIIASQTVDLRISQVVNDKKTVRAEIPNFVLAIEELLEK